MRPEELGNLWYLRKSAKEAMVDAQNEYIEASNQIDQESRSCAWQYLSDMTQLFQIADAVWRAGVARYRVGEGQ